jgi:dynein heavy chain
MPFLIRSAACCPALTCTCRVTDDLDRRCLTSVLRQFLSPRIVRDECAALTQSGTYYVPKDGSMESYREYIKALPR